MKTSWSVSPWGRVTSTKRLRYDFSESRSYPYKPPSCVKKKISKKEPGSGRGGAGRLPSASERLLQRELRRRRDDWLGLRRKGGDLMLLIGPKLGKGFFQS